MTGLPEQRYAGGLEDLIGSARAGRILVRPCLCLLLSAIRPALLPGAVENLWREIWRAPDATTAQALVRHIVAERRHAGGQRTDAAGT